MALLWVSRWSLEKPDRTGHVGAATQLNVRREMMMNANNRSPVNAWLKAGRQLEIRVEAPFKVENPDGTEYVFPVYLPDFRGVNGAVLFFASSPKFEYNRDEVECAEQYGYWWSICNQETYSSFDREEFVATLNDFQYFGDPDKQPSWYMGKPWGE